MIFHVKNQHIFLPFCHNARVWQTDRRTDRILIARAHLHSMQHGKSLFVSHIFPATHFPHPSHIPTVHDWLHVLWEHLKDLFCSLILVPADVDCTLHHKLLFVDLVCAEAYVISIRIRDIPRRFVLQCVQKKWRQNRNHNNCAKSYQN